MKRIINIHNNNDGNVEWKQIDGVDMYNFDFKHAITEEIIKYNKFKLSEVDKIYLLTHDLLMCQSENVLLNMKVNQLERDLKELKEKINS